MNGVINAALQHYVCTAHGLSLWERAARRSGVPHLRFEAMLQYQDALTERTLTALANELQITQEDLLEDVGVFLVTHAKTQWLHRLLRFSGENYIDFLRTLPDMPNRIAIAAFDIGVPQIALTQDRPLHFRLDLKAPKHSGLCCHVFAGLLRAMADSHNTLCAVNVENKTTLRVHVFDALQQTGEYVETRWGQRW